jgi:hypothetical protein
MSRKRWLNPKTKGRPGPVTVATPAELIGRPSPRRHPVCRVCCADEPLTDGRCTDRAACLARAPQLELEA